VNFLCVSSQFSNQRGAHSKPCPTKRQGRHQTAAVVEEWRKGSVGAYNWGFVSGKSQTIYPWDSWDKAYTGPPPIWFHDIFHADGTPYNPEETDLIKRLTQGEN